MVLGKLFKKFGLNNNVKMEGFFSDWNNFDDDDEDMKIKKIRKSRNAKFIKQIRSHKK